MFGLLLKFSGPVRNTLALVISLLFCGLLFYTYTDPVWLAWLFKYWVVSGPVIGFVGNLITKLTTWKGDDSFFAWIWKLIQDKRKD